MVSATGPPSTAMGSVLPVPVPPPPVGTPAGVGLLPPLPHPARNPRLTTITTHKNLRTAASLKISELSDLVRSDARWQHSRNVGLSEIPSRMPAALHHQSRFLNVQGTPAHMACVMGLNSGRILLNVAAQNLLHWGYRGTVPGNGEDPSVGGNKLVHDGPRRSLNLLQGIGLACCRLQARLHVRLVRLDRTQITAQCRERRQTKPQRHDGDQFRPREASTQVVLLRNCHRTHLDFPLTGLPPVVY